MNWTYDQSDPALMLFTAAAQRFGLQLPPHARVLELGCAETDFLERLKQQNTDMDLTGVDVRRERDANGWMFMQGDASVATLFESETFDAIILLGALEHFGLGFYGDPIDDDGDIHTIENITRWLKPRGAVYFDVPANPTYRITANRHYRVYSPAALAERLLQPLRAAGFTDLQLAYSDCEPNSNIWIEGEPTVEKVPYHYVAVWAERVCR